MAKQYQGLTSEQVLQSRAEHGMNILTPPARKPWWRAYLDKFNDPIIRILAIAALLSIIVGAAHGEYVEGVAIIVTIFLATFIAFWNERRANAEFDILNRVNDDIEVRVVRDGRAQKIARKDLVKGDVLFLERGEEVPADAEVLEAYTLEADEAKLTGETHPVVKQSREKGELPNTTYPSFLVLKGSLVADGHGVFAVQNVGEKSEIGAVALLSSEETNNETPLMKQLDRLAKLLGAVAFVFAGVLFAVLFAQGVVLGKIVLTGAEWAVLAILFFAALLLTHRVWLPVIYNFPLLWGRAHTLPAWLCRPGLKPWLLSGALACLAAAGGALILGERLPDDVSAWLPPSVLIEVLGYFMVTVAFIVVAVPEGLPLAVTLSLSHNMRKMTASNVLVRRLHACETIGAVTVICSDKTGTLTANEMRVAAMQARVDTPLLALSIAANSTALLEQQEGEKSHVLGNPTEGALLLWLESLGISFQEIRESAPIERQWVFTTERKFMATLVATGAHGRILLVKGAPEYVLERCTAAAEKEHGRGSALDASAGDALLAEIHTCQKKGMRTLGFAARRLSPDENAAEELETLAKGLEWLAFAAIEDPTRPEVPAAMHACMSAGVAVKVVTGDTPETAREVARQIGLWQESDEHAEFAITTGDVFAAWTDEELEARARNLKIMARARPADKLRLVQCLQRLGEVVAVTGDGTNDAPALNFADVGLAMGQTGTAVSKEASDIVLLDDSFASIVQAMLWGRSIYLGIQRFLIFQVTINLIAMCIVLLGPFLGVALPLTVMQMLWVNLIMDVMAAVAFASEPPDKALLAQPPRKQGEFIITKAMAGEIARGVVVFLVPLLAMILWMLDGSTHMLTIFFTFFVFLQIWNMCNVRSFAHSPFTFSAFFKNPSFWIIIFAIIIGQTAIVAFGGQVFRTEPLEIREWVSIVSAASLVFVLGEIRRRFKRRL
jgi:Ca2+-transporting ATPase